MLIYLSMRNANQKYSQWFTEISFNVQRKLQVKRRRKWHCIFTMGITFNEKTMNIPGN